MEKPEQSGAPKLTRREAIGRVALTSVGIASVLSGAGELAKLAAQGAAPVDPVPPPAPDPNFPPAPQWGRELHQLAPNVYAYTQGGGPGIPSQGVSHPAMIAGP